MTIRRLFVSTAIPALIAATASSAFAQVEITDARTTSVSTSTAGDGGAASDVTITSGGSVAITTGTAVNLDSDNNLINEGSITSVDANDTTGVLISGVTGNFTNTGSISLTATPPADGINPDSDITTGSGRTGILISGAAPFTGNVTNTGSIVIQGQNSRGIRLADASSVIGDILQNGTMTVYGADSIGLDIAGNITGNVNIAGTIGATGENVQAVNISGDISGGLNISAAVSASGFVDAAGIVQAVRPSAIARALLAENGNLRQASSAVQVSSNIAGGIHFSHNLNEAGNVVGTGGVNMIGSAPAILIDGNGTPIAIGIVAQITDPDDDDYDADLQYSFINRGELNADAFLDDMDSTTFSLQDAHLESGFRNAGIMRSTVYRSGIADAAGLPTHNSHARVIVIGNGGIAEQINNAGTIIARGFEAGDAIYADRDNILGANQIYATAIDILADGDLVNLTNSGRITAIVTARNGEAVAIRDASGTFIELNNSGVIEALGVNSDATGGETTNFNLIAIDVSANTNGFTLNQTLFESDNPSTPQIIGDIRLGSGDDVLNIAAGTVTGDISFGDGVDRLNISDDASVIGSLDDSDGTLEIVATNGANLTITSANDFNIASANFDETSTYSPFIDPNSGEASVMIASGDVSFADGATIDPRLSTVMQDQSRSFTIIQAGNLMTGAAFGNTRGANSPYLYNTILTRDPLDANTLILTLQLRSTDELGLDGVQAAAFSSAFEALQGNDGLGNAFVRLTDQTSFNAAYNQLLPEFSAAAVQFVMANIDGATGAIGSHLNSARRSQEKPGGLWIEQFAYFADKDLAGLSDQYRGYGFGITGGFDTAFGPFHTAGLNIGFATTEVEDVLGVDEPLDVLSIQGGVYGGMQFGDLTIDMYAGGGYDDFEANRNVVIGDFKKTATGDWSGYHYNGSLTAGYNMDIGKFFLRPSASLSYLNLNENAFTEEGSEEIILALDSRQVDIGTATGMVEFGRRFDRSNSWLTPSIRFGYRNDFIGSGVLTAGRFVNGTMPFALQAEDFPDSGILAGISFASGSDYASFSFDYDTDIRDGFIRHTARIVIRMIF